MASHRAPSIIEALLNPSRLDDGERLRHALERLQEDPALDFRVDAIDGGLFQASASTKEAFRAAAALAVIDAASRAETVLLEPIMLLSIITPKEFLAGVTSNLVSRNGSILSLEETTGRCRILANVAAAELFGYSADLASMTQGTGSYTQRLLQYRAPVAEGDDLDRDSQVGAPLRPKSPLRSSNMMLPEPVELDVDDIDALGPRFGW